MIDDRPKRINLSSTVKHGRTLVHLLGYYGDSGENESVLSVSADLSPTDARESEHNPMCGCCGKAIGEADPIVKVQVDDDGVEVWHEPCAVDHAQLEGDEFRQGQAVKLDLEDIERKARAAIQELWEIHVQSHSGGIDCVIVQTKDGRRIADAWESTLWTESECIANAEDVSSSSPPVVLAMVARIRRLEVELAHAAGIVRAHGAVDYADDFMRFDQEVNDARVRLR